MAGAPGLFPSGGHGEAGRQAVKLLKDVFDVEMRLGAPSDGLAEIVLDGAFDDEGDSLEPGAARVEERVVDDGVALAVDGGELLERAEAAAHPGGHNDKRGRGHEKIPPSPYFFLGHV